MDPGSLLRHRRKTEGSPGPDGMAEKGPWERPGSSAMGVVFSALLLLTLGPSLSLVFYGRT